ncbi:helix-turn-helix transcriptional regulator [Rhizohabitans arisaemae]|uniref:helix-turn-helix transcriptional regulator n=1 Tax=Rhizohabitans arisaemae TaxID=2720610 RepID=UPI0024B19EB4|nr:YafY family protein [Rhizohabitans arisaemae]
MRASRLLSVLLLLQTRGRLTAREIADELEVSLRTVYRDVESLSAAGVPVYADRGPAGGYRLLDGYRTRLTGLTGEEADSLFLAGLPGPASELGLGTVVAAAELKILAALPPELRSRAGRIRERFHLDAPGWFNRTEQTPFLAQIADAVWKEQRIRVRYRRWGRQEFERVLDPLGLVLKAGNWYMMARSGESVRTYRISRVLGLHTVPERFERPADFDLQAEWRTYSREFLNRLYSHEAVARISPVGLERLPHLIGPEIASVVAASAGPPDEEGRREVVIPLEIHENVAVDLFRRLGDDAEVLHPPSLRAHMLRTAREMLRRYADQGGSDDGRDVDHFDPPQVEHGQTSQ